MGGSGDAYLWPKAMPKAPPDTPTHNDARSWSGLSSQGLPPPGLLFLKGPIYGPVLSQEEDDGATAGPPPIRLRGLVVGNGLSFA